MATRNTVDFEGYYRRETSIDTHHELGKREKEKGGPKAKTNISTRCFCNSIVCPPDGTCDRSKARALPPDKSSRGIFLVAANMISASHSNHDGVT